MRKKGCLLLLLLGFNYLQAQQSFRIIINADSTAITGIQDATSNTIEKFAHPLPLLSASVNQLRLSGSWKIDSISPDPLSGWKIILRFSNVSKDTVLLENVMPFQPNPQQVYITGKGKHPLSRTHLFLPNKQPVNVIVPDNAWELGYNTIPVSASAENKLHLYGFSRRIKSSLQNGKASRFETRLYPGGQIQYSLWLNTYSGEWQNGLLEVFQKRKLYDIDSFNDSLYHRKDLSWMRHSYLMHLMMAWDKFYFDSGRNQISSFVERGNQLYGGDDIITLWPTWPILGLDQRNQFDLYESLPGGLTGIRNISNQLISKGKHLFVSYNPWDQDTRFRDHYKGLGALIQQTNSDGVVLDTQGSSSKELQNAADSVRKGVIMYSEGMAVPKDMQGIISGRVHNALYYPPMLNLNRYIQPGFAIFRVAELYKEPIQREFATSFFNGYGTEINIMAPGQPEWVESQYSFLSKTTQILRNLSHNFHLPHARPLIPTTEDGIWVNEWSGIEQKVYTIFSLIPQGFKNELFQVDDKPGYHWVDVYHHKNLTPINKPSGLFIEAETDPFHIKYLGTNNEGAVDCIVQFKKYFAAAINQHQLELTLLSQPSYTTSYFLIYQTASHPPHQPIKLAAKTQSIELAKFFGRFEGKLIIQLFGISEGRAICLDEWNLNLNAGEPRPVYRATSRPISIYKSDNRPQVLIPAGAFHFTSSHGDDFIPYPKNSDTALIQIPSFYMDVFPVTNADYFTFIRQAKYRPKDTAHFLQHWIHGKPKKEDEKKPVTFVSYEDAQAYAHFYGKELPTETQWQYAAQTSKNNEWPWQQNQPVTRERTTITETLDVIQIKGLDSMKVNIGNGKLDTIGRYPKGANTFGLQDLVGSVWQLMKDQYYSGSYRYLILKGGSYYKPGGSWWYVQGGPRELNYSQYLFRVNEGFERAATVGFRCIQLIQ